MCGWRQAGIQREFLTTLLPDFLIHIVHEGTDDKWGTYLLWLRRRPTSQHRAGLAMGCLRQSAARYFRVRGDVYPNAASSSTSDAGAPTAKRLPTTPRPIKCMGRRLMMSQLPTTEAIAEFVSSQCWWEPTVIRQAVRRAELAHLVVYR